MTGPARARLPDGRLHLQWGPIDLVIGADGLPAAVDAAEAAAWVRFGSILPELVSELSSLRSPVVEGRHMRGAVAARMQAACEPMLPTFLTPMAAVAGAVADEIVACFARAGIARASVNNGGDIALYLTPGACYRVGMVADPDQSVRLAPDARRADGGFAVDAAMPVRGIATSGWRGRSLSLGIADGVTVLARDGAAADVAATLIANAVDVAHPAIVRKPASQVREDTDLGERPVTVDVGRLDAASIEAALEAGATEAARMRADGRIFAAVLWLAGSARVLEPRDAPARPIGFDGRPAVSGEAGRQRQAVEEA